MKKKPQIFNDGMAVVYTVDNVAGAGNMPKDGLVEKVSLRYKERTVGLKRYYAAMENQVRVDKVIRCQLRREVSTQDVVLLVDGNQYMIRQVQYPEDIEPPVMDLTLERLAKNYDPA